MVVTADVKEQVTVPTIRQDDLVDETKAGLHDDGQAENEEVANDLNETELKEQENENVEEKTSSKETEEVEIKETEVDVAGNEIKVPETDVESLVPNVENQEPDIEELEPGTENQEPEMHVRKTEVGTPEVEVKTFETEVKTPQPGEETLKSEVEAPKLEVETLAVNADDAKQPAEIPVNEKDKSEPEEKLAEVDQWEIVQPKVNPQEDEKPEETGKENSQEGGGSTYLNLANQSEDTADTEVRKRRKSQESDGKKSRENSVERCVEESVNHAKRRTLLGFKYNCACCAII